MGKLFLATKKMITHFTVKSIHACKISCFYFDIVGGFRLPVSFNCSTVPSAIGFALNCLGGR